MYLKILSAVILLSTLSTGLKADVYKCQSSAGRVSYQQTPCPIATVQQIVRIFGNSSRIENRNRQTENPWVAKLAARQNTRKKTQRARTERQQENRERAKYAALTDKRDKASCKKYKALYKKRKKQRGVEVVNLATGKISLDKSKNSKDLISMTKDTRDMYCG